MEDELKNISPWLKEQHKKGDGFKTPEGYFDGVEDRVFSRIEAAGLYKNIPVKVLKKPARRFSLIQVLMAAAAAFALVLAAVWFFKPAPVDAPVASVELSEDEIEAYVLENVQDFDAEQLAVLQEDEEPAAQPPAQQAPSKSADPLEDLTPEDVEHILNDMTDEELKEIL